MMYTWQVCNTKEIAATTFPYMEKSISLTNYYDQAYRIWETEHAITLYQPGKRCFVLFKEYLNYRWFKIGPSDWFRLVREADGSITVYQGQEG